MCNCEPNIDEEMITIKKSEYDRLMQNDIWLGCLEDAGVDNWSGIEEAYDLMDSLPDTNTYQA